MIARRCSLELTPNCAGKSNRCSPDNQRTSFWIDLRSAPERTARGSAGPTPAGTCLGPYRIEGKLGEGGMGEVFRAVDTRLGRAVAIKITHERFSARFDREARAISSLNHPNICTLYDVGPDYLVMELVEGETLAARLKNGRCPLDMALRYGSQIAGRAGRGARKGDRSPRSETGQHHAHEDRASRFWTSDWRQWQGRNDPHRRAAW